MRNFPPRSGCNISQSLPNPWSTELPAASWELGDNKTFLSVVRAEDVKVANGHGTHEEDKRRSKRKVLTDSEGEEGDQVSTLNVVLKPLEEYLGTVVAKVFQGYGDAFEGVVVDVQGSSFTVKYHVNQIEETISLKSLVEMERLAGVVNVNHEAEPMEGRERPKYSPKGVEAGSKSTLVDTLPIETDPVAPSRRNESYEDRLRLLMDELVSKPYEELPYETKTEILYFLCQEVSDTNALREVVDRKMGIIVQTRKTWRTNPPIIIRRSKVTKSTEEQEKVGNILPRFSLKKHFR